MTRSLLFRYAMSLFLFASSCSTLATTARGAGPQNAPGATTIPLAARTANGVPGSGQHSLGFIPNPAAPRPARLSPATALPASVDLSQFAPPVGDQGGVESCTAWATGYYLRGWYARRAGYYPGGGGANTGSYEPMYTYSQIVHGQNTGTTFADNLNLQASQGIDTRADYKQGDYNFTDLPTEAEAANASHIRIASYQDVGGSNLQGWIESVLAGGNPVAIALPVYPEFDRASATNPLVGLPRPGEKSRGGHAVAAFKYDAAGLWIENSWGTSFGLNGWAELSWRFVNQYVSEAVSVATLNPGGSVPNVINQPVRTAARTMIAAGFNVAIASAPDRSCNYFGLVMRESPSWWSWAVFGSTVTLITGSRPPTPCP